MALGWVKNGKFLDVPATVGTEGDDTLTGQNGHFDVVDGGGGDDLIDGGNGKDALDGDVNDDGLGDGDDSDLPYGNPGGGDDGVGPDTLRGVNAKDLLDGQGGDDLIDGGRGADTLIGDDGNDTLIGGLGPDTFRFDGDDGTDVIEDFDVHTDTLVFEGVTEDEVTIFDLGDLTFVVAGETAVSLVGVPAADVSASDFLFT